MAIQKILICDDSQTDLTNLKNALKNTDCVVVTANNGDEAVAKAKTEKPDIIFMDIIMPGMDGFAACRALRDHPDTKNIPVIFVTSRNQKADKVWAMMQGAKNLISKPFEAAEITDVLAAF
ncbi:response regulator [Methylovulum psychrotolerans]|jgi:twitching motility two-component system response regulator PilH|uniref:Response regulator n=1 Tax=Methylovulum psychrotolerans TaxID=1704499 RepID=A0A1Z4C1I7_9GAMM|nr:response regulator [Methylovulum psychrotolerans]ASF47369.1 two-component system response regulator [Methylovulum psychrotolerans]MBT9096821.1 response regulator [Methylovulum psychrotolerans]POZ51040.1 response regulator [Methylovulum psychrotolerans]